MNQIKVKLGLLIPIERGTKTATTRFGLKTKYTLGPIEFINADSPSDILDNGYEVHKIEAIAFCDISALLAFQEGYGSIGEFKAELNSIYGHIDDYAIMTVIYWSKT